MVYGPPEISLSQSFAHKPRGNQPVSSKLGMTELDPCITFILPLLCLLFQFVNLIVWMRREAKLRSIQFLQNEPVLATHGFTTAQRHSLMSHY